MTKSNHVKRMSPIHPGEILREELMAPLGLSINGLARALRVAVTRIGDIVNERRGISADTARASLATSAPRRSSG